MPFHICMDEVLMFLALFPFVGLYFRRLHTWYHAKFNHKSHPVKSTCGDEHCHLDPNVKFVTKEQIDEKRKRVLSYDFGDPNHKD